MKNIKIQLILFYSIIPILYHNYLIADSNIKINISDNVPPQSGYNNLNKLEGLIIDLSVNIFRNYSFSAFPLARALEETKNEKNSLIFISRNASRENEYQWISPIYITPVFIYTKIGWIKKNGASLNKLSSIGVINGSSLILTLSDKKFMGEISTVTSNEQNLKKLLNERIDGWIEGSIVAEYIIKKENLSFTNFDKIGPILNNKTWIATSIKSDKEFISAASLKINKFKTSSVYSEILKKYSAQPVDYGNE
ncbi:substrate-binding periplasmic protein [Silvanigrella sp.]|jgi:ABC-type amino acid transport substrate-binding protein|uniref:substrate-binding periplasmic protein n=1 Tax=Silvanigrella sp. TaxID=2024976 RepID=UPI0037C92BAD